MPFSLNTFSILVKMHRLICVHTSVFMAFPSASVWMVENTNTDKFPTGAKFSVNETPQNIVHLKMATSKTRQNAKKTSVQNVFIWTDDKVDFLWILTNKYKVSKTYQSVDWESVQSKNADILKRFKQHIPSTEDNSESLASGKDSPHKVDDITKSILSTKLKFTRTKFRQSVDSGKRGGHRCVVWIHY